MDTARVHDTFGGGKGPRSFASLARWIIAAAFFVLVISILVQVLWNWLMPALFGMREITFFQAFGLIVLTRLFFGVPGRRRRRPVRFDSVKCGFR